MLDGGNVLLLDEPSTSGRGNAAALEDRSWNSPAASGHLARPLVLDRIPLTSSPSRGFEVSFFAGNYQEYEAKN